MKQRIKIIFAGALLALTLFGVAAAGPLEDGVTAYQQGDYAAAMQLLRPLADEGDAKAQGFLGLMYHDGHGVPQDYAQAVMWLRKAADQGFAEAQHNLGVMYVLGQGVPQDYVQAHMWFSLAASRALDAETRDQAVKDRDALAANMTPSQIAEAQLMARELAVELMRDAPDLP